MSNKILAVFCLCIFLPNFSPSAEILWAQYTQHQGALKLMAHLDANPVESSSERVSLSIQTEDGWQKVAEKQMYTLGSIALFEMSKWPNHLSVTYKLTTKNSKLIGEIKAIPKDDKQVRILAISEINDEQLPSADIVAKMIGQKPDLICFSGFHSSLDEIPKEPESVASGMNRYLQNYRKFGSAFKALLKDYPSVMISGNQEVYDQGYHPIWINSYEFTQVGTLPAPYSKGLNQDKLLSYYTSIDYGGIRLAILEDRKHRNVTDEKELQLLGADQEQFLKQWSGDLKTSGKIGIVFSHGTWTSLNPYSMTDPRKPFPERNRAFSVINNSPIIMISGGDKLKRAASPASVIKYGIKDFSDGPLSYSLPPFSAENILSLQENTTYSTGIDYKCSIKASMNKCGFGIITVEPAEKSITLDFNLLDEKSDRTETNGWPYTVSFK